MHLKKTDLFIIILTLCCLSGAKAQVYLNPFTQYGLGELQQPTQVNRLGMAGTAYTETDPNRYNFANPASYSLVNYFSFELGVTGNLYDYKNADLNFRNLDVKASYLSIAFPLDSSKKWGFSAGLMPYSRIGYDLQSDTIINGIHKALYQTGSGGLTRFYVGSSIRLFHNFYAGVNAGYIFGNSQSTITQTYPDTGTFYGVHQSTNNVTGGFLFDAGFVYNIDFKLKYKRDKALDDSFSDLYNQEMNQQRAVLKPVSPKIALERAYLKIDLQYEKSRDSLKAIKLPKEELKTRLVDLKSNYHAQKRAVKNSYPSDSFQNYNARLKNYNKEIKNISAQYELKKELLEKRKKSDYKIGLQNCEAKTRSYMDSVNVLELKDTSGKFTRKRKMDLKEASKAICSDFISYRNYKLQLGSTVNLPTFLPTTQTVNSYSFSNRLSLSDSLSNFTRDNSSIYMPLGIGGSVELRCENNWKVGITAEYRQWSKFVNVGGGQQPLNDYYSLGIGGQWTPTKRRVNNTVFTTANYKIGFRYSQTPYIVNNNPVNDMRFSLGLGLPLAQGRASNLKAESGPKNWPYLDLAIELGQTGTLSANQIQQQYVMLSLGFHIFELNWFQKRKLE